MTSRVPGAGALVVAADDLQRLCTATLVHVGVPPDDAALVAETLVRSEAEGAVSHGIARLPTLVRRIRAGVVAPALRFEVTKESGTVATVDAHDGIGQVVAARAMQLATTKAKAAGLGAVAVRNSSHLGRAGHPAAIAAEAGLIGVAASNASPRLVAAPGARAVLGNNPWAVAVPGEQIIVVDMANSVVAAGKIRAAQAAGERIPIGWAVDEQGDATSDAQAALSGALLAFGGHKGWALALVVDVLTGVLSGGAYGDDVSAVDDPERPQRSSHLFLALDVAAFIDVTDFRARMDDLTDRLLQAGGQEGRLPGQASAATRARRTAEGIPIRASTVEAIGAVRREAGLAAWP